LEKGTFYLTEMPREFCLPIKGYEQSVPILNIFIYLDGKYVQAFLLRKNKSVNDYILCGLNLRGFKLFGLTTKQIKKCFSLIKMYERNKTDENINLHLNEERISYFDNSGRGEHIIRISTNLSIIFSDTFQEEVEETNLYIVQDEIKVKIKELNFIGDIKQIDNLRIIIEDLDKKSVSNFHLLKDIKISNSMLDSSEVLYHGIILSSQKLDEYLQIEITSKMEIFDNLQMNKFKSHNVNPYEIIDFIARIADPSILFNNPLMQKREFTVYIPIINIDVECDLIGVGNVEILSKNHLKSDISQFSAFIEDQTAFDSIAKIYVKSISMFEAVIQARKLIFDALVAISHVVKNDSVFHFYNSEVDALRWDRNDFHTKPSVTNYVFIIDESAVNSYILADITKVIKKSILRIDDIFYEKIEKLDWYEERLSDYMNNSCTNEDKNMFTALKWLKRSWDADNLEDKVIYSNISIEFILASVKIPKLFTKQERTSMITAAQKAYFELNKEKENVVDSKIINDKISAALTNPPLMAKLEFLIDGLESTYDSKDKLNIHQIRKNRNDLVHGRHIDDLSESNINDANIVIGMIIAFSLKRGYENEFGS